MEEKDIMTITKNVVANFIDDEDKFIKQQTIDHIIQNGKYYDVISISKARVKEIVENGLKYEQLKKENEELKEYNKQLDYWKSEYYNFYDEIRDKYNDLKSSQNKVAIEKLEELSDIINENITDLVESGKSKYGWLDFSDTTNKLDTMLTELKGGK